MSFLSYRSGKWKFTVSLASVVLLSGVLVSQANASSLTQKKQQLQNLQSKESSNRQQLNQDQQTKQQLSQQIQSYQQSIQSNTQQISDNVATMKKLQGQIQQLDLKISSTQKQLQSSQQQAEEIVRAAYENGSVPYIQVLFEATSWDDFLNRLNLLAEVSSRQQQVVNQISTLQNQLNQEQKQQKDTYQQLSTRTLQLQTLVQNNTQLVAEKKQKATVVSRDASLRYQVEAELESQIHYTQAQITEIQAQTAADEAKMQNKSYVANQEKNLSNANVSALISYAETFEGLPYTPGSSWYPHPGFDCSGFVKYVFNHFGIDLPRTSEEQFGVGVPVSRANLQPGDLVFYATVTNGASHVGIYIGNGEMINSEGAGLMVTDAFSPYYWGPRYLGARDVIRH